MFNPGDVITWKGFGKDTDKPIAVVIKMSDDNTIINAWIRLPRGEPKNFLFRNYKTNVPFKTLMSPESWVLATADMFEDGVYEKAIEIL